jgi:hypothetical protein
MELRTVELSFGDTVKWTSDPLFGDIITSMLLVSVRRYGKAQENLWGHAG